MTRIGLAVCCFTMLFVVIGFSQGPNPRPQSWASCEKFDGVVTPNSLPVEGRFDPLYMMPGHAFKDGVSLISAFKPGDGNYNGGRWHLFVLKGGVDASKYANACRVEDLDLNDFQATDKYFTCPLLPRQAK
ncbi:MAG: hypothetical protein HY033_09250 [Ignavibacteriae bacterium]|nr:hypothetical protein [Ignavibacteria bacterium]MBI3365078.1 hypothetical protein [Ignavibacteriota bacterium]